MGPVGVRLPGWSHRTGLPPGPLGVPGAGCHSQRTEPAHALPLFQQHRRLVLARHLRMPLWPHPHLCKRWCFSFVSFFREAVSDQSCALLCYCDGEQSTTIILWVPLIVMSAVEMVFSFRCFAVCASFLYLCPCRREPVRARRVRPTVLLHVMRRMNICSCQLQNSYRTDKADVVSESAHLKNLLFKCDVNPGTRSYWTWMTAVISVVLQIFSEVVEFFFLFFLQC